MGKIDDIKEECIAIDLANVNDGQGIGTFVDGKFIQFKDEDDVRIFYSQIGLKELLTIYSSYMGLKCLANEEDLLEHGYAVNILEIIEYL